MGTFRDGELADLRELAGNDPHAALGRVEALLMGARHDAERRAALRWVAGIARREMGDLAAARPEFERALEETREPRLSAQIGSSLAYLLAQQGELDRAIELLERAEPHTDGAEHGRVSGQLGVIAYWRGDLATASSLLRRGAELAAAGDAPAEARYRVNLGIVLGLSSDATGAAAELTRAMHSADEHGLGVVSGTARSNLGFLAVVRGDLPDALEHFAGAERYFAAAGANSLLPRVHADHAEALADAGLLGDAESLIRQAIETYREQGQATELAGVLLTSAAIRLAASDADGAAVAAREAEQRFVEQDRESWAAVARALALQATARLGERPDDEGGAALAAQLDASADELDRHRWTAEATRARLVAAKVRADGGMTADVPAALRAAVDAGRASDQILLAHVDALAALSAGDEVGARTAIDRGLRIATGVQSALGAIETRSHAATHGHELVEVGARLAIGRGQPRELLTRIEATRVMAARLPSVRPPADAEMADRLAELRRTEARLTDPDTGAEARPALEGRRVELEREIRHRSRVVRGDGAAVELDNEIDEALDRLGERMLVAHAALDGRLYAVAAVDGAVGLHDLGDVAAVRAAVEGVAFSLNRLNRAQGSDASRVAAAEMLFGLADELAALLLPPVVAESFDPVVVVPTAVLHDVPWGLLPPLAGRPVVVNASLTGWARADRSRRSGDTATARASFVAGPGLEFADLEVGELSSYYRGARSLTGPTATGEACLDAFGASDLVHVACHGSFRRDNPLFSSLHVADGPLNVYDFERLGRLPDTIVLSACSVAGAKALQGGALLGLATALTTLGAATVIAPLTPISDASAVVVMQRLHQAIAAGAAPADALATATLAQDMADPTAAAFVALGA